MILTGEAQYLHVLPPDPGTREDKARTARLGRMNRGPVTGAALLHILVLALLMIRWPWLFPRPTPDPPPIQVALVVEQPPAPAPPPQPKQPEQQVYRQSGADQETTAPPEAKEKGAEAAPKPEKQEEAKNATESQPKAAVEHPAAPKPPKPKEAERETAPKVQHGSVDRAPGEETKEGDPYLNTLWRMIEQHRTYPTGAVGSLGLPVEGTVVYLIGVQPNGWLQGMRLERSSGVPALDNAARIMIEASQPFPPLPAYFPHDGVVLSVTIHLFPTAS